MDWTGQSLIGTWHQHNIYIYETYAGLERKPTHLYTEWLTFHVPKPKMGNSIPLLNLTAGVFSSLNAMTEAAKRLILFPNLKPFHIQDVTEKSLASHGFLNARFVKWQRLVSDLLCWHSSYVKRSLASLYTFHMKTSHNGLFRIRW